MVILDTNIIIDHLRTMKPDSVLMMLRKKRPDELLGVSVVTIQELYEGKSMSNDVNEKDMKMVLVGVNIVPYEYETAKKAGEINRNLKKKIESFDAAIAATCLINHSQLATLDKKDFAGIEGLEMAEV